MGWLVQSVFDSCAAGRPLPRGWLAFLAAAWPRSAKFFSKAPGLS